MVIIIISRLSGELRNISGQNAEMVAQSCGSAQRMSELQTELAGLLQEKAKAATETGAPSPELDRRVAQHQGELDRLAGEKAARDGQYRAAMEKVSLLQVELSRVADRSPESARRVSEIQKDLDRVSGEKEVMGALSGEVAQRISDMQAELDTVRGTQAVSTSAAKAKAEESARKIAELQAELALRADLGRRAQEEAALKAQLPQAEERVAALQAELGQRREYGMSPESAHRISQLQEHLDAALGERRRVEAGMDQAQQETSAMKAQLDWLLAEKGSRVRSRSPTRAQAAGAAPDPEMAQKMAAMRHERDRLQAAEIATLQAEVDRLSGKRDAISGEAAGRIAQLQAELDRLAAQKAAAQDRGQASTVAKLQGELDRLSGQRDAISSESAGRMSQLQADLERVTVQKTLAEGRLTSMAAERQSQSPAGGAQAAASAPGDSQGSPEKVAQLEAMLQRVSEERAQSDADHRSLVAEEKARSAGEVGALTNESARREAGLQAKLARLQEEKSGVEGQAIEGELINKCHDLPCLSWI